MGYVAQFNTASCRIDEIAQYDLAGFHFTGKKVFDSLSEKRLAETKITFYARPDRSLEFSLQRHGSRLSAPFRCLQSCLRDNAVFMAVLHFDDGRARACLDASQGRGNTYADFRMLAGVSLAELRWTATLRRLRAG